MQDLVAGQIDFMIDNPANALPQVGAGAIKAYAVTSKSRLAVAPPIPTVGEAGLPGLHALSLFKAPRSRSGGRSSRRPTSRRSEQLFDHLVGAREQRRRDFEAERLGGFSG